MDKGSEEELRVYTLLQRLEDRLYKESEIKETFGYNEKTPLRSTRLYKYLQPIVDMQTLETKGYKPLKGELVTGEHVKDRSPVLRGKYRITTVIDDVKFTYMERGE